MIRYDTTSDYHNYVRNFGEEISGDLAEKQQAEFGYVYLNRLFSFSKWGFLGVFAVSSAFIYSFFYYYLKKYDILCIGTFTFLCFGCMTNFDNIVRQAIAIAIFNYSLLFIQNKKYYIAILLCLIAPAFHSSAYIAFFFLLLAPRLQSTFLSKKAMYATIVILFVLYFLDFFSSIRDGFFSISFVINSIYGDYSEIDFAKSHIGIAFIIKTIICLAPISIIDKVKDKFVVLSINMSWVSAILSILFAGIPFFYRITYYLTLFNIIAVSYFWVYCWRFMDKRTSVYPITLMLCLLLFNHVISYYGLRNKYDTILGENCWEHRFYIRQTFDEVQRNGANVDRDNYYILNK